MRTQAPSRSSSPLARPVSRVREWRDQSDILRRLGDCDARGRERLLQDLNVTEPELTAVIRAGADSSHLLERMLASLALDYGRLDLRYPTVVADLRGVCAERCPG